MKSRRWTTWVLTLGLLAVAVGMAIPVLTGGFQNPLFKYIYAAGAVLTLVARLSAPPYIGTDLRLRRLLRMEAWSAVFYIVASFFSFYNHNTYRDWLAFTLAGAVVQIIASVMITLRQKK